MAAVSAAKKSRSAPGTEGWHLAPIPAHEDELMDDTFELPHRCPAGNGRGNRGLITAKPAVGSRIGFLVVNLSHHRGARISAPEQAIRELRRRAPPPLDTGPRR